MHVRKPAYFFMVCIKGPSYIQSIAKNQVLVFNQTLPCFGILPSRSIRACDSNLTSRRQGKLNLHTYENIYANNGTGFEIDQENCPLAMSLHIKITAHTAGE